MPELIEMKCELCGDTHIATAADELCLACGKTYWELPTRVRYIIREYNLSVTELKSMSYRDLRRRMSVLSTSHTRLLCVWLGTELPVKKTAARPYEGCTEEYLRGKRAKHEESIVRINKELEIICLRK